MSTFAWTLIGIVASGFGIVLMLQLFNQNPDDPKYRQ